MGNAFLAALFHRYIRPPARLSTVSRITILLLVAVAFSVIYLAGQPSGTIGRTAQSIAEAGLYDSQDIACTEKTFRRRAPRGAPMALHKALHSIPKGLLPSDLADSFAVANQMSATHCAIAPRHRYLPQFRKTP